MTDVLLCAKCGKGLRPGQIGTWQEFTALRQVGTKAQRVIAKRPTGRTFCAECALPPPTGTLWEPDGNTGGREPWAEGRGVRTHPLCPTPAPLGSKPLVGAAL